MPLFSRKNVKYLGVVIALLLVILVSSRGADNPAKGLILQVASPFLKTFRIFSGGLEGFFDTLRSIGALKNENERLLEENRKLLSENARFGDIEKENQVLRKELDLTPKNKYELEGSYIIAQDPQGFGNIIIIDKGENASIRTGMPVLVSGGLLVGRVAEVYPNTAKVILITDSESAVNAESEKSGARGIAKGEYGLGLRLDMISQTQVINEGDRVITSGVGGEVPRGLIIGQIGQVSQSEDKLFQEATLIPAVNFSNLRIIFIVKKF